MFKRNMIPHCGVQHAVGGIIYMVFDPPPKTAYSFTHIKTATLAKDNIDNSLSLTRDMLSYFVDLTIR